ncbi:MAG: hypothetical protein HY327_05275 [Chloroflexi bacterium]|nr:hypothetical protein [Chloroflexota bacterium]
MNKELRAIEISKIPELLRIVNEVRKSRTPRVLSRRKEPVAILRPINGSAKRAKRTKSKKDFEAFLASAGSWKDVDTDKLIKDIYESRKISSRPPVEL